MLKFRQFLTLTEGKKKEHNRSHIEETSRKPHIIPAVMLNPDYDMIRDKFRKNGKIRRKGTLSESFDMGEALDNHNYLSRHFPKSFFEEDPEEHKNIRNYTRAHFGSFGINSHLLGSHHAGVEPNEKLKFGNDHYDLNKLDSVVNKKPIGKAMSVYSGLGYDPRNQSSQSGHIHLPAYTSTSVNSKIASGFAKERPDASGKSHMMKIDLNEHNRGAYLENITGYAGEKEFLLPRATTLRIYKSEPHPEHPDVMVHHAVIDNNINPNHIERNIHALMGLHPNFHEAYAGKEGNEKIRDKLQQHSEKIADGEHPLRVAKNVARYLDYSREGEIIGRAIEHESTTPEDIHNLAINTKDPEHHKLIARNPKTSENTLEHLAKESKDSEVHNHLLQHPNLGKSGLKEIAYNYHVSGDHSDSLHKILKHPKTDSDVLGAVAESSVGNSKLQSAIMDHPKLSTHNINALSEWTKSDEVKTKIAQHPKTGDNILGRLARESSSSDVHHALLKNPKTSSETLNDLVMNSKVSHPSVLKAISEHPNADNYTKRKAEERMKEVTPPPPPPGRSVLSMKNP